MKLLYFVFVSRILHCATLQVKAPNGKFYNTVEVAWSSEEQENTEEAKEKKDIFDINQDISSPNFYHGDILPRLESRNTVTQEELCWPTTKIPFVYAPFLDLEAIGSIELAHEEFRLRTCVDFIERTDESNYISFIALNGCSSMIGMTGGLQYISIGSGCERVGVVCHEIMHALGVLHEQSRADRDDYVRIDWDNVEKGRDHNFDKLDWNLSDVRRVPYDYNSLMHYFSSSFSKNGNPTIVSRQPSYQDAIGQRSTFSWGDSTKINRMYNCSDTILYSYSCNYESDSICGYVQEDEEDDLDWIRHVPGGKSMKMSFRHPGVDATADIKIQGSYMMLDTNGNSSGLMGELRSMRFMTKSDIQCLKFSFFLSRHENSTASITAHIGYVEETTGEIKNLSEPIVTLNDSFNDDWLVERISIQAPPVYRIVFRGQSGGFSDDVIAVDDVSVQDKPCETSYFVVHDYSSVLESAVKGDYFFSPVLYTEEGYAFKIKIYPVGSESSIDEYMSMYFGLVRGPNDSDLKWPFCNRYVRLMVVDQNHNPLYAMNKYKEFLTSQDSGGVFWNKPHSFASVGYYGYRNFMNVTQLALNHNYLKHDSLMISVLIKDMTKVNSRRCSRKYRKTFHLNETLVNRDSDLNFPQDEVKGQEVYDNVYDYQDNSNNDNTVDSRSLGLALGVGLLLILVVSVILYCVNRHRARLQVMPNNVCI